MAFIYADSCIFIYLLEGTGELKDKIADIFAPKDFFSNRIAYSDLTKLECLVHLPCETKAMNCVPNMKRCLTGMNCIISQLPKRHLNRRPYCGRIST
jgi:hypothetical protein